MPNFQKSVKTGAGVRKLVSADTREELDEALAALRAETPIEAPDITNPDHANLTLEEFLAKEAKDGQ